MTLQVFSMFSLSENLYKFIAVAARGFAPVRLLGLRLRIPSGAWVLFLCCVLSGRGLCNSPIPRPGETYRVCVCVSTFVNK
jgi:hypothetical protein